MPCRFRLGLLPRAGAISQRLADAARSSPGLLSLWCSFGLSILYLRQNFKLFDHCRHSTAPPRTFFHPNDRGLATDPALLPERELGRQYQYHFQLRTLRKTGVRIEKHTVWSQVTRVGCLLGVTVLRPDRKWQANRDTLARTAFGFRIWHKNREATTLCADLRANALWWVGLTHYINDCTIGNCELSCCHTARPPLPYWDEFSRKEGCFCLGNQSFEQIPLS